MKDSKLLKTKDFLNNIKILNFSDKIIRCGAGYQISNSDIFEMIQIMNGYLHLMERVKDYERDLQKENRDKQEIKKTSVRIYRFN